MVAKVGDSVEGKNVAVMPSWVPVFSIQLMFRVLTSKSKSPSPSQSAKQSFRRPEPPAWPSLRRSKSLFCSPSDLDACMLLKRPPLKIRWPGVSTSWSSTRFRSNNTRKPSWSSITKALSPSLFQSRTHGVVRHCVANSCFSGDHQFQAGLGGEPVDFHQLS